ncbi:hypothetical protein Clacol_008293 [Clathrus columnatus]|uniref:Uncharacterized protein n=1 Tax=Clathrus columnatus TaxID=1419009 RepID=A0AAV5AM89_9AGAM|nr:hypothetical protein Clacol_008293 [Clathrus columnatus]
MSKLSNRIKKGLLNIPGATPESKATTERLLKLDHESHHCFFTNVGFHNHLSHHLLAAYDLGAPAELIQAIYDDEAKVQRPIDLKTNGVPPEDVPKPGVINDSNWTEWLGNHKAYWAFVTFFSDKVKALGIQKTVEEFVYSPKANGNNADMLIRVCAGLLHPLIQLGHGIEFECEIETAAGLAQAAVHNFSRESYFPLNDFVDSEKPAASKERQPQSGPSILLLLRQIYDDNDLIPPLPYDPDAFINQRRVAFLEGGHRLVALKRILQHFDPGHTKVAIEECLEEVMISAILLAFGTGKPNRKPRIDFFLMHLVTGSLFIQSVVRVTDNIEYQRALLRIYIQLMAETIILRGRPRIDPALLMTYTANPLPPTGLVKAHPEAIGPENRNPWLALIESSLNASDAHVPKTLRTLIYASRNWGTLNKGEIIGTWGPDGQETHKGISGVDGTVFIRAAGMLLDTLGWVAHGQKPGQWDRSALGWDDAWKNED